MPTAPGSAPGAVFAIPFDDRLPVHASAGRSGTRYAMSQSQPAVAADGGALSRELSDFLIELSIAMHKTAIYPAGHPLLETAVSGVERKLAGLLRDRPTLSVGVARRQLVIEGVATDPNHPLLRELAQRFHRHHLGALRINAGVTAAEIAEVLLTVAASADGARSGSPVGLGPPEGLAKWPHIKLFPLSYEQLQLLEGDEDDPGEGSGGSRAAQLWIGLARAALMAESSGPSSSARDDLSNDPETIAQAIDDHQSDEAYDQVIVGYLLQIAQELNGKEAGDSPALQARVSQMVASLDPRTLRRLLEMGGNVAQRKRFVSDAAQGMKPNAVIDLVRAAAESSNQTISHSLLRMFNKLAVHAEQNVGAMRVEAESALRDNVQRLIGGWGLADPNPDQYTRALDDMSRAAPVDTGSDEGGALEAERILQMSLETGAVGQMVWQAVDELSADGRIAELFDLVDAAPPTPSVAAIRSRAATQDNLRRALEGMTIDTALASRIASPLGLAAAEPLLDALDALSESDERTARALSDLLVALGTDSGEAIAARMPLASWMTQRRLIGILARLPVLPEGFVPSDYMMHPDDRVRIEALRLMLLRESHRERALRIAIADSDERMLRLGLAAALDGCPPSLAPVILRRLSDRDLPSEPRALAIRVLACSKARAALDYLVGLTVRRRRFWGRRLAPKSPEVLAALAGLAQHWTADSKARGVISLAARSSDAEVRAAVAPPEKKR
jgi:hypothetical protein